MSRSAIARWGRWILWTFPVLGALFRRWAARRLAAAAHLPEALPHLVAALGSRDLTVVETATEALKFSADRRLVASRLTDLLSRDPAAHFLADLQGTQSLEVLASRAREILRAMGGTDAAPALLAGAANSDASLSTAAWADLGKLDPTDLVGPLLEAIASGRETAIAHTRLALIDPTVLVPALLAQVSGRDARMAAATRPVLARVELAKLLPHLVRAWTSGDSNLASYAETELDRLVAATASAQPPARSSGARALVGGLLPLLHHEDEATVWKARAHVVHLADSSETLQLLIQVAAADGRHQAAARAALAEVGAAPRMTGLLRALADGGETVAEFAGAELGAVPALELLPRVLDALAPQTEPAIRDGAQRLLERNADLALAEAAWDTFATGPRGRKDAAKTALGHLPPDQVVQSGLECTLSYGPAYKLLLGHGAGRIVPALLAATTDTRRTHVDAARALLLALPPSDLFLALAVALERNDSTSPAAESTMAVVLESAAASERDRWLDAVLNAPDRDRASAMIGRIAPPHSDEGRRYLFWLLGGRAEAVLRDDFQLQTVKAAYAAANPALQRRLREAIVVSGDTRFNVLFVTEKRTTVLGDLTGEDAETLVLVNARAANWEVLVRYLWVLPARQIAHAVLAMREADGLRDEDRALLVRLGQVIETTGPAPTPLLPGFIPGPTLLAWIEEGKHTQVNVSDASGRLKMNRIPARERVIALAALHAAGALTGGQRERAAQSEEPALRLAAAVLGEPLTGSTYPTQASGDAGLNAEGLWTLKPCEVGRPGLEDLRARIQRLLRSPGHAGGLPLVEAVVAHHVACDIEVDIGARVLVTDDAIEIEG